MNTPEQLENTDVANVNNITPTSAPATCPEGTAEPNATSETTKPASNRRRWGTIQSLSPRTRKWINTAFRDGLTYTQILAGLKERHCENITHKQLRSWKNSGYTDWLAEQVATENKRLHAEALAASRTKSDKSNREAVRDSSDFDIALQIHDIIKNCNIQELRALMNEKPENFFRLIRAHAVHERNAIMRDRAALELKKYADVSKKPNRPKVPQKGGITREQLERIKREMKI